MMMKKWLIILSILMVALSLLLAGCSTDSGGPTGTGVLKGNVSYYDLIQTITTNANFASVSMTGTGLPSRSTHSDNSGNYLISNIVPGSYTVVADYSSVTNPISFPVLTWKFYEINNATQTQDTSATDTISVSNVTITDGTTTNLDFQLQGY
jgi:2',3'-cyclic-nucleotide 2'-phosphodiesterase (5'-nucleotidase family)